MVIDTSAIVAIALNEPEALEIERKIKGRDFGKTDIAST